MGGQQYGQYGPGPQRGPNPMSMSMNMNMPGGNPAMAQMGQMGQPGPGPGPMQGPGPGPMTGKPSMGGLYGPQRRPAPYPSPQQYMQNKRQQFPSAQQVRRQDFYFDGSAQDFSWNYSLSSDLHIIAAWGFISVSGFYGPSVPKMTEKLNQSSNENIKIIL